MPDITPDGPPVPLDLEGASRLLAWMDDTDTIAEWPAYTTEDIDAIEGQLPYDVDIYPAGGTKGMGLVGRVRKFGKFEPLAPAPAPQPSVYWDDALAKFVPSVVVWNGVCAGGVLRPEETEDGKWRRAYDGTLQGEWPTNAPRREVARDPAKAQLAALEEAA